MTHIPGQRIFEISHRTHPRFSDSGILFINLGQPIPGLLNLRYPRDNISQGQPGISLGYPAPGHIHGLSLRYPTDILKQAILS
jgi:hypothetical protein